MNTPTPRTDAATALTSQHRHDDSFGDPEFGWVTAGFARTLERELVAETTERDQLRAVFPRICAALGNGAFCTPTVSVGFIESIPNEVELVIAELRARAERAEADLKLLREWQRDVIQNASAHHAERKDAIARAESAEREAFDWKKIARYEAARAERAEADLAFQVARNSDLFTQRDEAFESQEKAETELTTEREKVRLLKARAAIDATMKEDAK